MYASGSRNGKGYVTLNIPKLADSIIIREDADIEKLASALGDMLEKYSDNMGNAEIGYVY